MHALGQLPKNAGAILKYTVNCAPWLGSDTLATAVFTVPSPLTKVSESNTTTTATVKVSGGVAGTVYTISLTFTTAGGETETPSFELRIE